MNTLSRILSTLLLLTLCTVAVAKEAMTAFVPLAEPELLVGDKFERSEGIAFNGGRGGNIWRVPVGVEGAQLNR